MSAPTIDELWQRGELRAATDASAARLAIAHPFRQALAGDDLETAAELHAHGTRCWHLTRHDEAQRVLDIAHQLRQSLLGEHAVPTLTTVLRLAGLDGYRGRDADARTRFERVIAGLDELDRVQAAIARRNFAAFLRDRGELPAAHRQLDAARRTFNRQRSESDAEYFALRKVSALLAVYERRHRAGLDEITGALETAPFADGHPFVATARLTAARALFALDRHTEAEEMIDDIVTALEVGLGDHPLVALALSFGAKLAWSNTELELAEARAARALTMYRRFYPDDNRTVRSLTASYADILRELGRPLRPPR